MSQLLQENVSVILSSFSFAPNRRPWQASIIILSTSWARLLFEGFEPLRKETFDPTEYARWVRTFETQHYHSQVSIPETMRRKWIIASSTGYVLYGTLLTEDKVGGQASSHGNRDTRKIIFIRNK